MKPPSLTLRWQLLLSYLPVILTPVIILGVVVHNVTEQSLTILVTREAEKQAAALSFIYSQYYHTHGAWDGVDNMFQTAPAPLTFTASQAQFARTTMYTTQSISEPGIAMPPISDALDAVAVATPILAFGQVLITDNNGTVVAGDYPAASGQRLSASALLHGAPLMNDNKQIGTLIIASSLGVPSEEKKQMLDTLNAALLLTGLLTSLGAVRLALWLSRQLTVPMQELTMGVRQLTNGKWNVPLKIHTRNEFANLTLAFNSMAEQIVRQQHQQRQMIADIAHDLRTPLSIIGLEIAGIRAGLQSPEEATNSLQEEVDWLQHLIDDLHTLSLLETGQFMLYPNAVSLTVYLEELGCHWQGVANKQNKTLVCEIAPNLPRVCIDPFRMRQVLTNLLNNAIQHTPDHTQIRLRANVHHDHAYIQVEDNGMGIAEGDLPHIFERFYRVDRARNRGLQRHGSGLGLSIAYQLVIMHHGTLTVKSQPGVGTTFTIRLPILHGVPIGERT
jgi:two-component system OmpR family sensor kinase/two-component system sensor histidine kinase BaeS